MLLLLAFSFLLPACRPPGSVLPTVKIGLVAPFEGRYRYVGYDLFYALRLALREANAPGGAFGAGGELGYAVELVAYDDGADPAAAAEQARKLAVDPDVVAVIGHFRADTTLAALPVYAGTGLPLLVPADLPLAWPAPTQGEPPQCAGGAGGCIFLLGPDPEALAGELMRHLARDLGLQQAALLVRGAETGLTEAAEDAAQAYSLELVPAVVPEAALPGEDWVQQVIASGAPAVIDLGDAVPAGEALAALQAAGWRGVFAGGPALAATDFRAVAGLPAPPVLWNGQGGAVDDVVDGVLFVTAAPFPSDLPGAAAFSADYTAIANGAGPGPWAAPAYDAARVILAALQADIAAHGTPSRAGVAEALRRTDLQGLLGQVTFDAGQRWAAVPLYVYGW